MNLSKVSFIFDTCSSEEANRYLRLGWKLYDISKTVCDYAVFKDEEIHYILLWVQETEPVYPALPPMWNFSANLLVTKR